MSLFDVVQRLYPVLTELNSPIEGEFQLDEERDSESFRSVGIGPLRVWSGWVNPTNLDDVNQQHIKILDLAPAHLDITALACESVDLLYRFELEYEGNQGQLVAEALAGSSALQPMMRVEGARVLNFEPSVLFALDDSCRLQTRLNVQISSNAFQVRTGQATTGPITVSFAVRQYWAKSGYKKFTDSLEHQRQIAEEWIETMVKPQVLQPLAESIRSSY